MSQIHILKVLLVLNSGLEKYDHDMKNVRFFLALTANCIFSVSLPTIISCQVSQKKKISNALSSSTKKSITLVVRRLDKAKKKKLFVWGNPTDPLKKGPTVKLLLAFWNEN